MFDELRLHTDNVTLLS